jgi:enoyl-CoA hydratase
MEFTLHERVGEIRMDDGKVNAMDPAFFDDLNALLDRAEREKLTALVIAGREGFFSPGLNVKLMPTLPADELGRTLRSFGNTLLRLWTFPVPTIAAITGHAVAGGLFLALACDRRIMARGAFRLHANEHAIGLPLPSWAIVITESVIRGPIFVELMLHARALTPDEALERRIVDEVTEAGMTVVRAREAAAPFAALSQPAYALSKSRLRERGLEWAKALVAKEMTGFPVGRS